MILFWMSLSLIFQSSYFQVINQLPNPFSLLCPTRNAFPLSLYLGVNHIQFPLSLLCINFLQEQPPNSIVLIFTLLLAFLKNRAYHPCQCILCHQYPIPIYSPDTLTIVPLQLGESILVLHTTQDKVFRTSWPESGPASKSHFGNFFVRPLLVLIVLYCIPRTQTLRQSFTCSNLIGEWLQKQHLWVIKEVGFGQRRIREQ